MAIPTGTAGQYDVRADDLMEIDAGQTVDLFPQIIVIEARGIYYEYPCHELQLIFFSFEM